MTCACGVDLGERYDLAVQSRRHVPPGDESRCNGRWIVVATGDQARDVTRNQVVDHLTTAEGWRFEPRNGEDSVTATSTDGGSAIVDPPSSADLDAYPRLSEDDAVLALISGIQVRITAPASS